jgi:hypothetical protein
VMPFFYLCYPGNWLSPWAKSKGISKTIIFFVITQNDTIFSFQNLQIFWFWVYLL